MKKEGERKDRDSQGGYKANVGVGGGMEKREREEKNEREREKSRAAQRESNCFTLELFELNI